MDLLTMRKQIDRIDAQLIRLLNKRLEFGIRTKRFKNAITDTNREAEILAFVKANSRWVAGPELTEKIFNVILSESRRLQTLDLKLVGFQGEHGALSEAAIKHYNKDLIPIPCIEYGEIFEGVQSNALDFGMVPVENSLEGSVSHVNDLLIESDLKIIGEVRMPVHHCLLALPDTDYREIKVAYSHPQSLAHCRGFLARNKLEGRMYFDTAGAALMLSQERPTAAAVIASKLCAEIYQLHILKEGIEDNPNTTRYFLVAKESSKTDGKKCSIVFATDHRAGALFEVIKLFSDANINLTRIESRPMRKDPGQFAFMLDFAASLDNAEVAKILKTVEKKAPLYKFLGCYDEFIL